MNLFFPNVFHDVETENSETRSEWQGVPWAHPRLSCLSPRAAGAPGTCHKDKSSHKQRPRSSADTGTSTTKVHGWGLWLSFLLEKSQQKAYVLSQSVDKIFTSTLDFWFCRKQQTTPETTAVTYRPKTAVRHLYYCFRGWGICHSEQTTRKFKIHVHVEINNLWCSGAKPVCCGYPHS